MYDLILQTAIVISVAAMIYLLARAVPRAQDDDQLAADQQHFYFEELIAKIPLTKMDAWFSFLLAKFLRRLHIITLKFDNLLHRSLVAVRHHHQKDTAAKNSFIEELGEKEEEL